MPKFKGKLSTPESAESSSEPEGRPKGDTDVKNELDQLKGELKGKKEDIEGKQTESKKLEKEIEQLSKHITELENSLKEAEKTADAYDKALENIDTEISAIKDYYKTKWPQIELTNKDKKEKIEEEIKKIDEKIVDIQKKLDSLNEGTDSITAAETKYNTAKKNLEIKQKNYDDLKNFQKTVEGKVKELKDLRKSIESEEDLGNTENTYALIKDLDKTYKEIQIKTKDELAAQLNEALIELKSAKTEAGAAELDLNSKKEEQKVLIKKLEDAKKNRKSDIFEAISRN